MIKSINLNNIKNIHFIGIGGISMGSLAKYLLILGKTVTGSDTVKSSLTCELESKGVKVYYKQRASNIKKSQLVVYSSAISQGNPELKLALKKKLPILKRSELLNLLFENSINRIAVCGSHGKTTTTAMIANVFIRAGKFPTVFLGGESKEFSNFMYGKGEFAIAEACEYKKNLLDLNPTLAVVLNIDNDHLESYGNMEQMVSAFNTFIKPLVAVVNTDDINSKSLYTSCMITYGIKNDATYKATNIRKNTKGYSFNVCKNNQPCGRINLHIRGKHNIYNALACFAVADNYGIKHNIIKKGLEKFTGVKRRNEYIGDIGGMEVYADYAHHPKEIMATLKAFEVEKGETLVVFQPHTYSRTRLLLNDFEKAFEKIENLIIFKTYPAREKFDKKGDATVLYDRLKSADMSTCLYAHNCKVLKEQILEHEGRVKRVLVLGAGDIYEIAKSLISK